MARFRPSRRTVAIVAPLTIAAGLVAAPANAGVTNLLGLGDLLGILDGHNAALCAVDGLLSIAVDNDGQCADGSLPVSLGDLKGPKGDPGTNGTNGTNGAKGDTGATGAQGPAGAKGANGVSGYQIVSKSQTLKKNAAMTWTMSCPSGKKATGGGVRASSAGSFLMQGSGPSAGGNGWTVTMVNVSKSKHKITGYAICAAV